MLPARFPAARDFDILEPDSPKIAKSFPGEALAHWLPILRHVLQSAVPPAVDATIIRYQTVVGSAVTVNIS
jgi:hypothetical protein